MTPEQEVEQHLAKILKELTDKENLQKIGDEAVRLIKKRTKLGYGVSEQNGTKTKLKPLSDAYKKSRKKDDLSEDTTANKSNLTNSGKMLDDLKAMVKDSGSVEIGFEDVLSYMKANWVSDDGRKFNNLSAAEIKQLNLFIEDLLKKELSIINK